MGDSSVAPSFSSPVGMLSDPEALWWFKLLSNFGTPSSVTSNRLMSGCGLGPRFGRLEVFALVKTEENCSFRRRVLLILSLCSLPSLSSEATPVLSHRLTLDVRPEFVRVIGHVAADHVIHIFLMSSSTVELHLFLKRFVPLPVSGVVGLFFFLNDLDFFLANRFSCRVIHGWLNLVEVIFDGTRLSIVCVRCLDIILHCSSTGVLIVTDVR